MDGSPLVTKLAHFVQLSGEDVRVLDALCVKEERFEKSHPQSQLTATSRTALPLSTRFLGSSGFALA